MKRELYFAETFLAHISSRWQRFCAMFIFLGFVAFAQAQDTISFSTDRGAQPRVFDEFKGYHTFGLDVGLSYLSSDVKAQLKGIGFGMQLEENIRHNRRGIFDVGWRGRLMYASSYGQDATRNYGIKNNEALNGTSSFAADYLRDSFVYNNFRNRMFEGAAEGVITFNRWRENRGVYFTLFGGIGLNVNATKINQLDASGLNYKYKALGETPSVSEIRSILDDTYETEGDGYTNAGARLNFIGTTGAELGVHVTPRTLFFVGHRVSWTGNDMMDGQRWNASNGATAKPDYHNYTHLGIKWIVGKKNRTDKKPEVEFSSPNTSPYTTLSSYETVRARTKYIENANQVELTVNGVAAKLNFYESNQLVVATIPLKEGENYVRIFVKNEFGTAEDETVIIYKKETSTGNTNLPPNTNPSNPTNPPAPTVKMPTVRITQPNSDYVDTENENLNFKASVTEISRYEDITLTINGTRVSNFRFSYGEVSTSFQLAEGRNDILIAVRNSAGSASDQATVVYRRPVQRVEYPSVRITSTGNPTSESNGCRTTVTADIRNIANYNQISVLFNGRTITNFAYSNGNFRANLDLQTGRNDIEITARNEAGSATDRANIDCQARQATPPRVTIQQPAYGTRTNNATADLRATVTNVTSQNDISFTLNGQRINDFSFDTRSGNLSKYLSLNEGENRIVIRVTNGDGTDEANTTVIYERLRTTTPPRVVINRPTNNSTQSDVNVVLDATVTNVSSRNDVRVQQNGNDISFTLSGTNVRANATLRDGANTFTVTAQNADGTANASTKVTYLEPIKLPQPPRVTINAPSNGSTTAVPSVILTATTSNIENNQQIQVSLNGNNIAFTFDRFSRQIRANLELASGENTIRVEVRNADGTDAATTKVTYQRPLVKPIVVFEMPLRAGTTTPKNSFNVRVRVQNVTDKNQVQLQHNGANIAFDFNNNVATATITLKDGRNNLRAVATNNDGSAEASTYINYTAPVDVIPMNDDKGDDTKKPTDDNKPADDNANSGRPQEVPMPKIMNFSVTRPLIDPLNPQAPRSTITATLKNVTGRGQISLFINGSRVNDFTFNASSKSLSHTYNVSGGQAYTIVLRIITANGVDEKTETIQF